MESWPHYQLKDSPPDPPARYSGKHPGRTGEPTEKAGLILESVATLRCQLPVVEMAWGAHAVPQVLSLHRLTELQHLAGAQSGALGLSPRLKGEATA